MDSEPELYLSDIEADDDRENTSMNDVDASVAGLSVDDKPSVDVKGKKCLDVGMASEEDIEGFLAEDSNNIVMILESGNAAVCIERGGRNRIRRR